MSSLETQMDSAVLTYVATVAWPQGPALLGAPRFYRPHFQNLLCAFSSARHVHQDPRNLISLNHREKVFAKWFRWNVRRESEKGPAIGCGTGPRIWLIRH